MPEEHEQEQQEFSEDALLEALQEQDVDPFAGLGEAVSKSAVSDEATAEDADGDAERSATADAGEDDDEVVQLSRAEFDRLMKAAEEGPDSLFAQQGELANQQAAANEAQAQQAAPTPPTPPQEIVPQTAASEGMQPFSVPEFEIPELEVSDDVLEEIGVVDTGKFKNLLAQYGKVIASAAVNATLQSVTQGLPAQIVPFAARAAESFVEVSNFVKQNPELENVPRMWTAAVAAERRANPNKPIKDVLEAARDRVSFATEIAKKAAASKGKGRVVDARNRRGQFAPGGTGTRRGHGDVGQEAKDGGILAEMAREQRRSSALFDELGITG